MIAINPLLTIRSLLPATNSVVTPEGRQYDLQPGQLVHATVAEGGQSSVLLDINQQKLAARTETPLQTGQQLRLLVEETTPQLKLRLIKDSVGERLTHAVHLLEGKWDLPDLLTRLAAAKGTGHEGLGKLLTFFAGFGPALEEAPAGKQLRALVSKMGLTLEAELARNAGEVERDNLKSALLNGQKQLPEQDSDLSEEVGRLLQKIELFQLCNLRLAQQGAFLIPLPLPFLENGYLIIEHGGKEETDEAGPAKVSLFLTLKKLGELRIDLLHEGEGLFLRFTCGSLQQADFIAGFEKELRNILTGLPLLGASYGCGGGHFDTDLIRRVLSDEQDLLNTRV
jgi:hypothetical protein